MPRLSADPAEVPFGTTAPASAPTAAQTVGDIKSNQWRVLLFADGGNVTITGPITIWRYHVRYAKWIALLLPWNLGGAGSIVVLDAKGKEDIFREMVGVSAIYLQMAAPTGGTLSAVVQPIRGGA